MFCYQQQAVSLGICGELHGYTAGWHSSEWLSSKQRTAESAPASDNTLHVHYNVQLVYMLSMVWTRLNIKSTHILHSIQLTCTGRCYQRAVRVSCMKYSMYVA